MCLPSGPARRVVEGDGFHHIGGGLWTDRRRPLPPYAGNVMKHHMGPDDCTTPGFGLANERSTAFRIPKVFSILTLVFPRAASSYFVDLLQDEVPSERGWEASPSRTPLKKT